MLMIMAAVPLMKRFSTRNSRTLGAKLVRGRGIQGEHCGAGQGVKRGQGLRINGREDELFHDGGRNEEHVHMTTARSVVWNGTCWRARQLWASSSRPNDWPRPR